MELTALAWPVHDRIPPTHPDTECRHSAHLPSTRRHPPNVPRHRSSPLRTAAIYWLKMASDEEASADKVAELAKVVL
eukprot:4897589-Alexandrium_andersonii.AAC.1